MSAPHPPRPLSTAAFQAGALNGAEPPRGAMSGHADREGKTTFRAWIRGPLSGAMAGSQTAPIADTEALKRHSQTIVVLKSQPTGDSPS